MDPLLIVILVATFALLFDLANGWNDAANAIATVVGTRSMTPWSAVVYGALLNFAGAFYSDKVAKTVGADIVDKATLESGIGPLIFMAAVAAAPVWITICTFRGLPISCSHSLLGALVGAAIASGGSSAVKGDGIAKIVRGVLTSPLIGFAFGFLLILLISWTFRRARPSIMNPLFKKLQILSAGAMAFSHGTGDAQKAMGIITGAMIGTGYHTSFDDGIPVWVRVSCATAMGVGTMAGGWAVMRTLGTRLTHLRPYQGFAAEAGGAATILLSTLKGIPISTTHSITGSIMGVGAAHGARAVRWGIGKKILFAWIFTFPVCLAGGALFFWLFESLGFARA